MVTKAKYARMTEEQKERVRENNREYKRRQSANMTEEEKQQQKQQQREDARKYWANRTEEQIERDKENARNWQANMTEEQKEREREKGNQRYHNLTVEQRKHRLEASRKWWANRTEEQIERWSRKQQRNASRVRAKQKGVPFNLTLDHLNEIWPPDNKCPILGVPFVRGQGEPISTSPSIDRIEPAKGYTIGNVQVISRRANLIKSDATAAQVMIVAQYLVEKERERAST